MPVADPSAAVPPQFRCTVFPERARVRVAPEGELDLATAPILEAEVRELLASGFDEIVIDLARLDFLDSTGLRLFLTLHVGAEQGGYRVRFRQGPPAVQRIFELTGVVRLVDFEVPLYG